jgi:hypothetical protein
MNLVGKIFVVLIFAMSLMFMSFAVAVYGTHQNWKEKAAAEAQRVQNLQETVNQHEADKKKLEEQLAAEEAAHEQAVAKLNTARDEFAKERDALVKQRDALLVKDTDAVAALDSAQQNLARLTKEVDGLRGEIRTTQDQRDKDFERAVELTDQIQQAQGEVRRLEERRIQLAAQLASANLVLDRHGLHKDMSVDGLPPQLRGKVLAINRDNMLEISLGSDDGLQSGHTLEIFRGNKYLGRMEVLHATSDRAVGKVIPGYKKGIIQKDDDVATRFKVG